MVLVLATLEMVTLEPEFLEVALLVGAGRAGELLGAVLREVEFLGVTLEAASLVAASLEEAASLVASQEAAGVAAGSAAAWPLRRR